MHSNMGSSSGNANYFFNENDMGGMGGDHSKIF